MAEQVFTVKKEGATDFERFFKHQLFIAGLKEEIQMKIVKAGKTSTQESIMLAQKIPPLAVVLVRINLFSESG